MSKVIYIGNLPFWSTEKDLEDLFGRHGVVDYVKIVADRQTGRPRNFAFVAMEEAKAAAKAIRALDGTEFGDRRLEVNEARGRRTGPGGKRY